LPRRLNHEELEVTCMESGILGEGMFRNNCDVLGHESKVRISVCLTA